MQLPPNTGELRTSKVVTTMFEHNSPPLEGAGGGF
jgi:hypothetical protein